MRINNNIMALNANRQLGINNAGTAKSLEKLSSGFRINRAGDDAAGLAISEKMRGQIRGLNMASRNAQDGISFIQTAEGALTESHAILQRMRELAVQSANDTNVAIDRSEIQKEMDQLASELTRIANDTEYNTQTLLNGGITDTKFHIGANEGQDISLNIGAMDAFSLGVAADKITKEATVADGSNIDKANLADNVGAKVVDGAEITFKLETVTATEAQGSGKVGGSNSFTFKAGVDNGAAGNITIKFATGTEGVAWSGNELTVTLSATGGDAGDGKYTASKIQGLIQSATTDAPAGLDVTKITVTADSTDEINATGTVNETITLTGGKDAGDFITVSAGTDSKSFIIADATATNFTTGTDADFGGITINLVDGKTLADLDDTADKITITLETITAKAADLTDPDNVQRAVAEKGIDVSSQTAASSAITTIQSAIETVSAERSKLGAMQNRLEHTIKNLDNTSENLQAAESRIRDVDMAKEMMEFIKQNILQQAATAMLAQANQAPQTVLQLLR